MGTDRRCPSASLFEAHHERIRINNFNAPLPSHVSQYERLEEARALAFSDPVHATKSSIVAVYEWNAQ